MSKLDQAQNTRPRRTTAALIRRAVEGVTQAGIPVGGVEIAPGGIVRVLAASAIHSLPSVSADTGKENSCDTLFGTGESD